MNGDNDRNLPASKGDIQDLRAEMRGELKATEDRLVEAMRDNQTEMLKAFYSFATSAEARFKDAETSDTALRQRLSAVEFRLTQIEHRLNMPPAA